MLIKMRWIDNLDNNNGRKNKNIPAEPINIDWAKFNLEPWSADPWVKDPRDPFTFWDEEVQSQL